MILSILEHWVWAVFFAVIALGLAQTRTREVSRARAALLPAVMVPGSWVPVTLILGLFVTKYGAGVCLAIHPSLAANTSLTMFLSLTYGTFAGLFWGRARSLLRLTRGNPAAQPA
jgi:hypothetical protein